MEPEDKKIVECPNCHARYLISSEKEGRSVTCKACRQGFQVEFEPERPPDDAESGELEARTFGRLAVKYRFLTSDQLTEAITHVSGTAKGNLKDALEEYLLAQKLISIKQLKIINSIQEMREIRTLDRSFAEMALKNVWVSKDKLEQAFKEQERLFLEEKRKIIIGEILVEKGVISQEQRDSILVQQNRLSSQLTEDGELDSGFDEDGFDPLELGFEITISSNRLEAFISRVGDPIPGVTVRNIRALLDSYGIVYGQIDDASLQNYLNSEELQRTSWRIAKGTPPREGKAPSVKYYFDTDPHQIAAVKDGELPDFKDRGVVPQVAAGDVVAEKIPGLEGAPGMNIFGETIPKPAVRTIILQAGSGAEKSEDGFKILAKVDGRPEVQAGGRIAILPYFEIAGDVDYETGNVIFDGHVEVKGSIKDEFWVKSGSLQAKEILKAEVDIQGDVNVLGGIIGGRIKCGGNLRAKYIQGAVIQVEGDLLVETELRFSKVAVGGACMVNRGKILGSWVSANKSIDARQIGSDAAEGSVLTIGIDRRIQKKIEHIKLDIMARRKEQARLKMRIEELEDKTGRFNRRIGEINEVWDRAMGQKVEMDSMNVKNILSEQDLANLEKTRRYIESVLEQCQTDMDKLADEHEAMIEKIVGSRERIDEADKEIHEMDDEIERLVEESKSDNFVPFVRVTNSILANTKIKGRHSTMIVAKDTYQVMIKERKSTTPDGKSQWEMFMSNI